jgi:hypothetical protein
MYEALQSKSETKPLFDLRSPTIPALYNKPSRYTMLAEYHRG